MYRKRSQSGPVLNEPEHLSAKWKMLCHTQRRTVKSDQEVQSVPFCVARQYSRLRGIDVAGRVNVGPRIRLVSRMVPKWDAVQLPDSQAPIMTDIQHILLSPVRPATTNHVLEHSKTDLRTVKTITHGVFSTICFAATNIGILGPGSWHHPCRNHPSVQSIMYTLTLLVMRPIYPKAPHIPVSFSHCHSQRRLKPRRLKLRRLKRSFDLRSHGERHRGFGSHENAR